MYGLNPDLMTIARSWVKDAFVPSDVVSGGGGGAPPGGDPSGGGAPPGGDPSAAGGGPPPDPSTGGGGMPPPSPDISSQVAQGVQQAMSTMQPQGGAGGAGMGMKPPKPDINTVATDVFQLKKLIMHLFRSEGRELPPDILDGPNRDPVTGMPAASPTGGSDPSAGGQGGGAPPAGADPSGGAIQPIQPMQPAFGGAPGGKTASDRLRIGEECTGPRLVSKAAALAMVLRRQREFQKA